jgi:hypothetical protein
MFTLQNSHLSVRILDPVADRHYSGSRYVSGGYIFQIRDADGNDLLSGPRFGDPAFNVFDGQGAPELFVPSDTSAPVGDDVLVPGVGLVKRTSAAAPFHVRDNPVVSEFTVWDIDTGDNRITMKTTQRFREKHLSITRTVLLNDRTIESATILENQGSSPLPIRWFAHPFFPLSVNGEMCIFSLPVAMPENPGYALRDDGMVIMKSGYHWEKGLFLNLGDLSGREPLSVRQRHPILSEIGVTCDFAPGELAIWANHHAFSFEAFLEKTIRPGGAAAWGIRYSL